LAFCTEPASKHKVQEISACNQEQMAPTGAQIVHEVVATLPHAKMVHGQVKNLLFFSHFGSFFRLETPRNMK